MNLLKPNFKGTKKLPKFITSKIFEQKQNMNRGVDLSVPYNFGKVWRNMISLGYNVYFIFSFMSPPVVCRMDKFCSDKYKVLYKNFTRRVERLVKLTPLVIFYCNV